MTDRPANNSLRKLNNPRWLIYGGFTAIMLLFSILLIIYLLILNHVTGALNDIVLVHDAKTQLTHEMRRSARERSRLLYDIVLENDAFTRDDIITRLNSLGFQFDEARRKFRGLNITEKETQILNEQAEFVSDVLPEIQAVIDLSIEDRREEAITYLLGKTVPMQNKVSQWLDELVQFNQQQQQEAVLDAEQLHNHAIILLAASVTFIMLLSIYIALRAGRATTGLFDKLAVTKESLTDSLRELSRQNDALDQHAIVSITDRQGRITHVNDKFCAISQYSREELLGQNHRLLNSGMHPPSFFVEMWKTISSGKIWHGEICNYSKDGNFYWVESTIVPFLGRDGKPDHYVSMRTDITSTKEANTRLEQGIADRTAELTLINAEIEFDKKALEAITTGTASLTGQAFFNELTKRIGIALGVRFAAISLIRANPESRTADMDIVSCWPADIKEISPFHGHTSLADEMEDSTYICHPDQITELYTDIPMLQAQHLRSLMVIGFHNTDGVLFGHVSIMDSKPMENIHRYRQLMSLFALRAGAELERQQAEQRLRDAYKHKSEFLSNMSHELRTPLNSVIGFSKTMLKGIDGPITEDQEESLNHIARSGQHLLGLISEILDMSRLEAGKMEIEKTTTRLPDLINDAVATVRITASDKGLDLTYSQRGELPPLQLDPTRIKQVMLNLLSNAVKFTDTGSVSVNCSDVAGDDATLPARIRAELGSGEHYALITVRDSGIGIAEQDLDKVFEEFRQVDNSSTRKFGGTGLGLAISKRLIDLHAGHIWVESAAGEGSVFSVLLPISRATEPLAVMTEPA